MVIMVKDVSNASLVRRIVRTYDSAEIDALIAGAGGGVSPTSTGDALISIDGATWSVLGIGTAAQVLTVTGGVPTWEDAAGGINPSSTGDIQISTDGVAWSALGIGATGDVLNIVGGVPVWGDPRIVYDLTPQLGGDLDVNGHEIISSGNITLNMGDNAGANKVTFTDSDDAEVAYVNSNGEAMFEQVKIMDNTTVAYGLIIESDSTVALGADRILTIDVDNAARDILLSGNLTVEASSIINQDLTTDATVTFAGIDAGAGNDLTIKMGDNAAANKVTFTDSDDAEVINIDSNGTINGTLSDIELVPTTDVVMTIPAAGQVMIDGGTTDHTGTDLLFIDLDVNSTNCNAIGIDVDVGTALSAAEVVYGISVNVDGDAGDDAGSWLSCIYMTTAGTSGGDTYGLYFSGTNFDAHIFSDGNINIQLGTSDGSSALTLLDAADVLQHSIDDNGDIILGGDVYQTTDDTATITRATAIAAPSVVTVTATVTAGETDETNRASYIISALFYRNTGGDVTKEGATTVISTVESDGAWVCDLVATVGTQSADVQVTGPSDTTIDWKVHVETQVYSY